MSSATAAIVNDVPRASRSAAASFFARMDVWACGAEEEVAAAGGGDEDGRGRRRRRGVATTAGGGDDVALAVGGTKVFPPIYFSEPHKNKAPVPRHVLG